MTTDSFVIRCVVVFLGLAVLGGMVIGAILALDERSVPDFIVGTTSAAIGALAALLARTSSSSEPAPVHVVNQPRDAIPVEETPAPAARTRKR